MTGSASGNLALGVLGEALVLLREVNCGAEGDYRCVYANVEAGQTGREDAGDSQRTGVAGLGGASG